MLGPARPVVPRFRREKNWAARFLAVLFVAVVVGVPLALPVASARAPVPVSTDSLFGGFSFPCGERTSNGWLYIIGNGLLQPTYICAGTFYYGDALTVAFVNFGSARSVEFTTFQNGSGATPLWSNSTFFVGASNVTQFDFTLPSTATTLHVRACMDFGCVEFTHATPITALPSGFLDVGGIDLLVFGIAVEMGVLMVPLLLVARWMARKALWAPSSTFGFALLMPHVVAGFLIALAVDFPDVDRLFGGWQFVVFPILIALMLFTWSIHLFNVATPALALQPDPQGFHRLRFRGWRFFVGELPDGSKVLIGRRWRDFVSRLFGHFVVLSGPTAALSTQGPAQEFPLLMRKLGFRARPDRRHPLDDFEVIGNLDVRWKDQPRYVYFVDHDVNLRDDQPKLSVHRVVPVPAVLSKTTGEVVREATTKRVLSWPHYIDVPPNDPGLAGIHYIDTIAGATEFIKWERTTKRTEEIRVQNGRLRATLYRTADDMAEARVADAFRFYEVETQPLSEYERREDARPMFSKAPPKENEGTDERPKAPSPSQGRVKP